MNVGLASRVPQSNRHSPAGQVCRVQSTYLEYVASNQVNWPVKLLCLLYKLVLTFVSVNRPCTEVTFPCQAPLSSVLLHLSIPLSSQLSLSFQFSLPPSAAPTATLFAALSLALWLSFCLSATAFSATLSAALPYSPNLFLPVCQTWQQRRPRG